MENNKFDLKVFEKLFNELEDLEKRVRKISGEHDFIIPASEAVISIDQDNESAKIARKNVQYDFDEGKKEYYDKIDEVVQYLNENKPVFEVKAIQNKSESGAYDYQIIIGSPELCSEKEEIIEKETADAMLKFLGFLIVISHDRVEALKEKHNLTLGINKSCFSLDMLTLKSEKVFELVNVLKLIAEKKNDFFSYENNLLNEKNNISKDNSKCIQSTSIYHVWGLRLGVQGSNLYNKNLSYSEFESAIKNLAFLGKITNTEVKFIYERKD